MRWHAGAVAASALACGVAARVPSPWHHLDWLVLVPWLAALDATRTWRGALASGAAMAAAFSVAVFSWFPVAMADYAGAPVWLMAAVALLATPLFQPQFVAFALVRHAARVRRAGRVAVALAGAGAYVGAEWAFPKLFGDTLGLGLAPSRVLRQFADVAGLPGLTVVMVLANECVLAALVAMRARASAAAVLRPLATLVVLVGGLGLYGRVRLAALDGAAPEPPITAGVVQANVAHYDRLAADVGTYEAVRRILDAHFAVSDELLGRAPLDLLVWPETVYPTTFGRPKSDDGAAFDRAIAGLVAETGRPLVFGSYDAEGDREYNAAVFLQPDRAGGVTYDTYRKATLFPFTERVPQWLDGPRLRAWLPWLGSWQPGTGGSVMEVRLADGRRLRIAPLICYDAVEPSNAARAVRDGAEIIMTLSNDSWLTAGDGARLHLLVSTFRSIETRRPQLRATPTGISAVVTPTGDVLASAGADERAGLVGTVSPVHGAVPLAARWGSWLGPVGIAWSVLALLVGGRTDG